MYILYMYIINTLGIFKYPQISQHLSEEGVPLTDFMPPAEAARAVEILGRGEVDGTISANVFHTRHAANKGTGDFKWDTRPG